MTLGIFGDSFCADYRSVDGWPGRLSHTIPTVNYSKKGTSIWYSFEKFLDNYSKHSHVIFCYTNENRIHHLPEHLNKYSFLQSYHMPEGLKKEMSADVIKELVPIWNARKLTFSSRLDNYLYQSIFNDVNRICRENSIRLVNVMPYELVDHTSFFIDVVNRSGPCVTALMWLAANESGASLGVPDPRLNHLSRHNNESMYNLLIDLLEKNDTEIISVKEMKEFEL